MSSINNNPNELKFSDEIIVRFVNTMRGVVQKEIQQYFRSLNIETFIDLSVKSVNDSGLSATLQDLVTKEVYPDIPNHTGLVLNVGDTVRMYQGGGYSYIGHTFGNRTQFLCHKDKEEATDKT